MSTDTTPKMSRFVFFSALIGLTLAVFLPWGQEADSSGMIIVKGKIINKNNPLSGVKVFVNEAAPIDLNALQKLYYEPTNKEGEFVLRFRAVEDLKEVKLVCQKEGFREEIIDLNNHSKHENAIILQKPVHLEQALSSTISPSPTLTSN